MKRPWCSSRFSPLGAGEGRDRHAAEFCLTLISLSRTLAIYYKLFDITGGVLAFWFFGFFFCFGVCGVFLVDLGSELLIVQGV